MQCLLMIAGSRLIVREALPNILMPYSKLEGCGKSIVSDWLIGGPCRDRTCDHLIKSQMPKSAFNTAITALL